LELAGRGEEATNNKRADRNKEYRGNREIILSSGAISGAEAD